MLKNSIARSCYLLLLALCTVFAGCSEQQTLSEKQRLALEERVADRWQALESRDFEQAWEYTSPNYRAIFPKQLYVKKFSYAVKWELTGIEIVNYDGAAAVASVVTRVMSEPTKRTSTASELIGATPTSFREQWIFTEGQWWFSAND